MVFRCRILTTQMATVKNEIWFSFAYHCCTHYYRPMVHWNRCHCHRDDANDASDDDDDDDSMPNYDANDVNDCCCCYYYLLWRSDRVDFVAMAIDHFQRDRVPNAMRHQHYRHHHRVYR